MVITQPTDNSSLAEGVEISPSVQMLDGSTTSVSVEISNLVVPVSPRPRQLRSNPELDRLVREFDKLVIKRGILYRKTLVYGSEVLQIVLPGEFRAQAMKGLHDDVGHMGRARTLSLLPDRYFWPGRMSTTKSRTFLIYTEAPCPTDYEIACR